MAGRGWAWTAYDWDEGPLQLHRRRAEHVPGLERDAARRARRLRARLLPRLPDRPRLVHRRVLRQPRLGRRERLGRAVRHSGDVGSAMLTRDPRRVGYVCGLDAVGLLARAHLPRTRTSARRGSGNIGATNVWRVYGRQARHAGRAARHGEGLRAGARRDAARGPRRRRARRRRGDARALPAAVPAVPQGREDGGDDRRRVPRRRADRRRLGAGSLARRLPADALRLARVDRRRRSRCRSGRGCSATRGR